MKLKFLTIFLSSFLWIIILTPFAFAQHTTDTGTSHTTDTGTSHTTDTGSANPTLDIGIKNPITTNNFQEFIKKVLDIVLSIGIPIIALFLIYSGFLFVTAQGNAGKLTEAKNTFIWTCVGAAVLLGAWVIANAIGETINQLKS